jgi:hypothetical protein
MKFAGLIVTLAGWVIPVAALPMGLPLSARFAVSIGGIGVSLIGILVILNGAHLKNAIWKK